MSLEALFGEVVKANVSPETWGWLQEKSNATRESVQQFILAFAAA
jgi:hypothetical protein